MKKTILFIVIILVILFFRAKREIFLLEDFYSLSTMVAADEEYYSWLPFSDKHFFLKPSLALDILETYDYPYPGCFDAEITSVCDIPKALYVVPMLNPNRMSIVGYEYGTPRVKQRVYKLIRHLLSERGEPINAQDHTGKTMLHYAVELQDKELMKIAMEYGIDESIKMNSHPRLNCECSAKDYLEYLYLQEQDKYKGFYDYFYNQ